MENAIDPNEDSPLQTQMGWEWGLGLGLPAAASGHFDELRARLSTQSGLTFSSDLAEPWQGFFENAQRDGQGDWNVRARSLSRQIQDNGVTYNVYADKNSPQRPWSLDLFPLIIGSEDWAHLEAGVLQRMQLLEHILSDIYGPQDLVKNGLIPPALVQGHPGYLRAMHGCIPAGGTYLHVAAFDLAHGPDGNWWVVSQRMQAPSGLGYLLENRLAVSRVFPQAFESLHVQRVGGTYRALIDSMKLLSPQGQAAHIALLTPGPYNETYFEHAYLARYLGISLVEGNDLIVRDQRLFLKTMRGLVPVHALLKRLDDQFLDPLELRSDSTLGVPGLLQAVRAGNVLIANAPGTAFLESPALLGFMPALSRRILCEDLRLPALPTWWCGERAACQEVLPQLGAHTIKPTFPGSQLHPHFDSVLGPNLSEAETAAWKQRILRYGDAHTVQAYVPLSQMPTWRSEESGGRIVPRSFMLRVFAVSQGAGSWRVLPGGLARVAGGASEVASMQQGGSSADVWVIAKGAIDKTTLLQPKVSPDTIGRHKWLVTSRSAENLFWLGRYTERAENSVRLARLILESLSGEDQASSTLLQWLGHLALSNNLVLPGVPLPSASPHARRVFERALIGDLGSRKGATSVGYTLQALRFAGSAVRERLSQEQWNLLQRAESHLLGSCAQSIANEDFSAPQALTILQQTSEYLAAITGMQTDRMTRDDGWRLLSIGRHLERLVFLANALIVGIETGCVHHHAGFEAILSLFDSAITFHAQFQQSRDLVALVNLLVLDRDNPRSLAWVASTLSSRLRKLATSETSVVEELAHSMPDIDSWSLRELCGANGTGDYPELMRTVRLCSDSAARLSDRIGAVYFTHSGETGRSVGA